MNQKLFAAARLIFACQQTQIYTVAFSVCLEPKNKEKKESGHWKSY